MKDSLTLFRMLSKEEGRLQEVILEEEKKLREKLQDTKNRMEEIEEEKEKLEEEIKEQNKELIAIWESTGELKYVFIEEEAKSETVRDDGTLHIQVGNIRGCFICDQEITTKEWNKRASEVKRIIKEAKKK